MIWDDYDSDTGYHSGLTIRAQLEHGRNPPLFDHVWTSEAGTFPVHPSHRMTESGACVGCNMRVYWPGAREPCPRPKRNPKPA